MAGKLANKAREEQAQATYAIASRINERIEHSCVFIQDYRFAGDRRGMTAAQLDREATYLKITVNVPLPATDTERIERIAREIEEVLKRNGVNS